VNFVDRMRTVMSVVQREFVWGRRGNGITGSFRF
jgi:hypothetical protein